MSRLPSAPRYELEGRKTQEVRTGGGLQMETTAHVYDDLGRLCQVTLPDGTLRTYGFDLDSNRTSIVENAQTVATYAYDPQKLDGLQSVTEGGQQRVFAYDTDGNTTSRGSDTLAWDGRGRHSGGSFSGTSLSYGFDAAGARRLRTGAGTTTHYRLGGLYETTSGGTITNTDTQGPAGDLAHYAGSPTTGSTVSFLYYNGHGDLAAEANTSGTRTAAYTYDPFGNLRSGSAPANATSERWTGKWDKKLDSASALVEMGARPYDPSLGRFLSVDLVECGSANAYDYARHDPVNTYDLTGLAASKKPRRDLRSFRHAIRECERELGRELSDGEVERVRRVVESEKLPGQKELPWKDIRDICVDMFRKRPPPPGAVDPTPDPIIPPIVFYIPLFVGGGLPEKAM